MKWGHAIVVTVLVCALAGTGVVLALGKTSYAKFPMGTVVASVPPILPVPPKPDRTTPFPPKWRAMLPPSTPSGTTGATTTTVGPAPSNVNPNAPGL